MQRVNSNSDLYIENFNFIDCLSPYVSPSDLKILRSITKNFKEKVDSLLVNLINSRKLNFKKLKINTIKHIDFFFKNKCSSIITLDFADKVIYGKDLFEIIKIFPTIHRLYLKSALISEFSISYFINMPRLRNLSLIKCNEIENYMSIGKISSLESLRISCKKVSNINFLESLPLLRSLKLNLCSSIRDFNAIRNLTNLTSLNLYDTRFENSCTLANLVANLNLHETKFDNSSILAKLSNLRKLNLLECNIASVEFLENMPFLEELKLSGLRPISNINSVESCNLLRDLTLMGRFISINFLPKLSHLTNLDVSYLYGEKIVEQLSILKECSSLKKIIFPGDREMNINSGFSINDALQKYEDEVTIISDSDSED